jgi:hypothetical protein
MLVEAVFGYAVPADVAAASAATTTQQQILTIGNETG